MIHNFERITQEATTKSNMVEPTSVLHRKLSVPLFSAYNRITL